MGKVLLFLFDIDQELALTDPFFFPLLFSGSPMVYPFRFDIFFAGRYYQRNGLAIRRHSCRLQYVAIFFLPSYSASKSFSTNSNTNLAWLFELAGGAIMDFEDTCIPRSQREASFTIAALHQWEMDLIDDVRCIDSAEEVSVSSLLPSSSSLSNSCLFIFLITVDCRNFEAGAYWRSFPKREFLRSYFGSNSDIYDCV